MKSHIIYSCCVLILLGFGSDSEIGIVSEQLTEKFEKKVYQEQVDIPQITINKDLLELHPNEGKWYYKEKPFGGFAQVFHPNGELAESIGYYKGKKEGPYRAWYADGSLRKSATYINNKLNGQLQIWSSNLQRIVVVESNYKMGVRDGLQRRWYATGQLLKRINMVDGQEVGMQQAWLPNGKIYINYEARNGRTFGLRKATLCHELDDEIIL